jgi:hypothetical protein
MVTIKKINREHERCENQYTGASWIAYRVTEEKFLKDIENLCNTIGEENIISVQFLHGDKNDIDSCIITHIN